VIVVSAVGVILTPIYLLSMLRQVFYGNQSSELHLDSFTPDIKPRELFIAGAFLVPIIGIGIYPKLLTQTYDVKTVDIAVHARQVLPVIADQSSTNLFSQILTAPRLAM
jgi:NAD(P)H-quinone oxidoreductase subunit 4